MRTRTHQKHVWKGVRDGQQQQLEYAHTHTHREKKLREGNRAILQTVWKKEGQRGLTGLESCPAEKGKKNEGGL